MSLKNLYEEIKKDPKSNIPLYWLAWLIVTAAYGLWILLINIMWNKICPLFNLPHLTYLQVCSMLFLGYLLKCVYTKIR